MQDASEQHPIQFFTASILEWKHLLKSDKYKDIIIESLRYLTGRKRIEVFTFIIMPNHIHLIWRMCENSKRENVQRDFLKFTSQQIIKDLEKNHPLVLEKFKVDAKDRAYQVWERNALSVDIYSRQVLEQKLDYI
jgi:REP-associated tyrosine transposase